MEAEALSPAVEAVAAPRRAAVAARAPAEVAVVTLAAVAVAAPFTQYTLR